MNLLDDKFFSFLAAVYSMGMSVAMPPAVVDTKLDRCAPESALFFTASCGSTKSDPATTNKTEQFLMEPDVRTFVSDWLGNIRRQMGRPVAGDSEDQWLRKFRPTIFEMAMTRPLIAYVRDATGVGPAVSMRGAAVVELGGLRQRVVAELDACPLQLIVVEGHSLYKAESGAVFGVIGSRLVAGTDRGEVIQLLKQADTAAPAWLATLRKRFPVERPSKVMRLDFQSLLRIVEKSGLTRDRDEWQMMRGLGLTNLSQFVATNGLDGKDCVRFAAIDLMGPPQGVMKCLTTRPIHAKDLSAIPKDPLVACAIAFDVKKLADILDENLPDQRREIDAGVERAEEVLRMRLREGFLASLGHIWTAHIGSPQGLIPSRWTVTVQVEDKGKVQLGLAMTRLRELARQSTTGNSAVVKRKEFQGHAIEWMPPNRYWGFASFYCLTDTHLVLAPTSEEVISTVKQLGGDGKQLAPTIADHPRIHPATPISAFAMLDHHQTISTYFQLLGFGTGFVEETIRKQGLKSGGGPKIPSRETFLKYADDAVIVARANLDPKQQESSKKPFGIEFEQRHHLPMAILMVPTAFGILISN